MTSRNDITGDKLQTKTTSEEYRNNYDNIFGTPLYNIPHATWVEDSHNNRFFYSHINGEYAICYEIGGAISQYNCKMKVKISENQNGSV